LPGLGGVIFLSVVPFAFIFWRYRRALARAEGAVGQGATFSFALPVRPVETRGEVE
jgi:hypothetical protein